MSDWPSHGGCPERMLARFGLVADGGVLDFSANLNPLGLPSWLPERFAASLAELSVYPDPDYTAAREAIARSEGLTSRQVRLTNGGAEAIFLAAALLAKRGARRVVVVQPTFCEYERACHHYGIGVEHLGLAPGSFELNESRALDAMSAADAVFLCRPNNPTGTLVERDLLERMLSAGQRRGSTLVVDEAFIDFVTPDERLTPLLACYDNLLLLRSMTKLYAIPGLRLGYLLGNESMAECIAGLQLPWSVNAPAAALVAPLLEDRDYRQRTQTWLASERPWLQHELEALGLRVVPSRANFLLLQDSGSRPMSALLEHLARCGILARHTHNFLGLNGAWLRLAVRSRQENMQLLDAIACWGTS